MSGLLTLRNAVIDGLRDLVPDLLEVKPCAEPLKGLGRVSIRQPGALVASLGARTFEAVGPGKIKADAVVAVFIVTAGRDRLDVANSLAEQVALAASGNNWGLPHTGLPSALEAEVLSDQGEGQGAMFMGVSWRQMTRLARLAPTDPLARADDRAEAEALGQNTVAGAVFPSEVRTVIDHPDGWA